MSIPSLLTLCAQKIVSIEFFPLLPEQQLPAEVKDVLVQEGIGRRWHWCFTPQISGTTKSKFFLTALNYENLCGLWPAHRVTQTEFLLCSGQTRPDFRTVSKIIKFVREKGRIIGAGAAMCFSSFREDDHRSFGLYYRILPSDRANLYTTVEIAHITLPHKGHHAVEISINPLLKINEAVISKWTEKTYNKVRDFVIYYINQLVIDNANTHWYCFSTTTTDNRLYFAQHSKDNTEAMQHLFGKYTGPSYGDWLLD